MLTALRCGSSRLRLHTGAWAGLPEAERLCLLCGDGVESEQHFILECAAYAGSRARLLKNIDALLRSSALSPPSLSGLSKLEQLAVLAGGCLSSVGVKDENLTRKVQTLCMVTVAEWEEQRKAGLALADEQ